MNLPPLPELPERASHVGSTVPPAFTADQLRAYALSYGRAVQQAIAAEWEYRHGFDKHGVAAAIRKDME